MTTVKTRYGTFDGFVDEKGVKTWLGIPYAQPPVGNLRWQATQPLQPSDKTFDAKKFGASAIQEDDAIEKASQNQQSEDCLTLNIWKKSEKNNLPVMVWIHGGSFMHGGSFDPLYNGANLASSNDVIVVSFNYRLNIFGFMNFGAIDKNFEDSSHLGINDQIAALKWVKENIAEFGGNPENITIFGESAGSISCMLLSVTPAAKGLFQKAIPQSGPSRFVHDLKHAENLLEDFMNLSGAKNMSDLMKKSSAELREIYIKLFNMRIKTAHSDYIPYCDGKFLPSDPFTAMKNGDARGIKFLTGINSYEWGYWLLYDENYFKNFYETHDKISLIMSRYKSRTSRTSKEVYKDWLKNRPDTDENYMEFINQLDWRVGQELDAENQSKFEDVYYYLFTEISNRKELGACHSLEVPFVFGKTFEEISFIPNQKLVKQMQAAWTNFAATGSPDNEFIPHWEKYSANNRYTMEFNSKGCVCHKDLNTEALNALRYVYEN
ncbi:MAG: carboxylesterase family protein [Selenomonadaceae bacterium]|nr:carboxylesterase family protein [Selenomonadaceae bacterium]MBR6012579.1 carboxylesterase family protein [Selenomonadaceae bacterium]